MLSPLESETEYEASLALVSLFYNALVSCDKYIYIITGLWSFTWVFSNFAFYVTPLFHNISNHVVPSL